FQSTSLEDLIQEVVCDLEATLESSGGSVDVRSLPVVEADPFQMRQMFQNLIANALKFHRQAAPSRVTLDSRPNGDGTWTIWIQDNGIGFEEKYLGRIFKPFERLHGKNEFSGSGMGLAICRKIIQRHGGTITAESRVNEGTRFVITLPEKQT
ncbi:MAG: histidine kinase, partial [Nitrospinaceae bacterium]|nr:histidine kinase [Nitrospinaceae bacterium]NIR54842.1 histidine kinase [Nitrospinaceae bacterium]NIS85267.1 histidine kinase [Nitrospinaceae bacterium]NIT82080.1 histidine kinase [Nitrospinaceae bacterium]NIU44341.1 histidine kinase [Nitrospinaceae bacterium]